MGRKCRSARLSVRVGVRVVRVPSPSVVRLLTGLRGLIGRRPGGDSDLVEHCFRLTWRQPGRSLVVTHDLPLVGDRIDIYRKRKPTYVKHI